MVYFYSSTPRECAIVTQLKPEEPRRVLRCAVGMCGKGFCLRTLASENGFYCIVVVHASTGMLRRISHSSTPFSPTLAARTRHSTELRVHTKLCYLGALLRC